MKAESRNIELGNKRKKNIKLVVAMNLSIICRPMVKILFFGSCHKAGAISP